MADFPPYYCTKTLLGGGDVNRRIIYDATGRVIAVFNQEMKDWTLQNERELEACLNALLRLAHQDGTNVD